LGVRQGGVRYVSRRDTKLSEKEIATEQETAAVATSGGAEQVSEDPKPAGRKAPWTAEDFDPDRAARLFENLTAELAEVKAKRNELSSKLQEYEDAQKSELEKAQEAAKRAAEEAQRAMAEKARLQAAVAYGLPEKLIPLLGDGSEEEIKERAALLASEVAAKAAPQVPGRPDAKLTPGHSDSTSDEKPQLSREDLEGMSRAEILEAKKNGQLDALLGR